MLLEYLKDNFNDNSTNTGNWTAHALAGITTTEINGRLEFTLPGSATSAMYGDYITNATWDLTNSHVYVQVPVVFNPATHAESVFRVGIDNNNYFQFLYDGGNFLIWRTIGGVNTTIATIARNAVAHQWLQIRESGGVIYWETSPDSKTWTTQGTYTYNPLVTPVTALFLTLSAYCYQNETSAGTMAYDNVNVPNPATIPYSTSFDTNVFGWDVYGGVSSIQWSNDTANTGNSCLKLTSDGTAWAGTYLLCQGVTVGDKLIMKAFVRGNSQSKGKHVQISIKDEVDQTVVYSIPVKLDDTVFKELWVATKAGNTGQVSLNMLGVDLGVDDVVYLDDVSVDHYTVPVMAVSGRKLTKDQATLYIRGINYSNIAIGNPNSTPFSKEPKQLRYDLEDIKAAGFNTLRLYMDQWNKSEWWGALSECYRQGINVIVDTWIDYNTDLSVATGGANRTTMINRLTTNVTNLKDNPAVIAHGFGNEANYNLGVTPKADYYSLLNNGVASAKVIDSTKLFTTENGEVPDLVTYNSSLGNLDYYSANIYRGTTFGSLNADVASGFTKPFVISEFGFDRYNNTTSSEDESGQATRDLALIQEVEGYKTNVTGWILFQWVDEWWKFGAITTHDPGGETNSTDPADSFFNEEWFGISEALFTGSEQYRVKKQAYTAVKNYLVPVNTTQGTVTTTVPRGVAASGLEFGATAPGALNTDYFVSDQATYDYIEQKGFNIVRLPFMWERLQPTLGGALDPTYKGYIDDQIAKATADNLKIILDCHNYGRRNLYHDGGITEPFTSSPETNLQTPWSDYFANGKITLRDYGRSFLGTANNPVASNGYVVTTKFQFKSRDTFFGGEGFWIEPMYQSESNKYSLQIDYTTNTWKLVQIAAGVSVVLTSGSHTWDLTTVNTLVFDVNQGTNGKINATLNGSPLWTLNSINSSASLLKGRVGFYAPGMHIDIPGNLVLNINGDTSSGGGGQYRIGDPQVTTANFADLWSRIASAYKTNNTVYAYDLMNEPHDMPIPTTSVNYKPEPVGVTNFVLNPGLEAGAGNWTFGTGFSLDAVGADAHAGSNSIKQVSVSGFDDVHSDVFAVSANTDYNLTFYSKVAQTSGTHTPIIEVNSGGAYGANVVNLTLSVSSGYVLNTISFNSGVSTSVAIRLKNNGDGVTANYDDFSVTTGVTTATVTAMNQAATDAIRLTGDTKWIIWEFDPWSGGQNFVNIFGANPKKWWSDVLNKVAVSFHYYFDPDHSGSYSAGYLQADLTNIPTDLTPMLNWAKNNGVTLYCGEYGTPNDDSRWINVLNTFLGLLDSYTVWATHWAMGNAYTSPTTLQPIAGVTDRLQMQSVGNHLGLMPTDVVVTPPTPTPTPTPTPPPTTTSTSVIYLQKPQIKGILRRRTYFTNLYDEDAPYDSGDSYDGAGSISTGQTDEAPRLADIN